MNLTRNRNQPSKNTGIDFPLLDFWNPLTKDATIVAQVNGQRVMCRIPFQLLEKRYGTHRPMQLVAENRTVLEAAARKRIEDSAYEEDGSILLSEADI